MNNIIMPLIFKLVGCNRDNNFPEIKNQISGYLNLSHLKNIFMLYGIDKNFINEIIFIIGSEAIKDSTKTYLIDPDNNKIIYVLSQNKYVKLKLMEIFNNNKNISESKTETKLQDIIPQKIMNVSTSESLMNNTGELNSNIKFQDLYEIDEKSDEDEYYESDEENIEDINTEIVEFYNNDNFKQLLQIYKKTPELFGIFFQFISNGNIVEEITNYNIEDFKYIKELEHLNDLNLNLNQDMVKKLLVHFEGHMNLVLRYILCLQE